MASSRGNGSPKRKREYSNSLSGFNDGFKYYSKKPHKLRDKYADDRSNDRVTDRASRFSGERRLGGDSHYESSHKRQRKEKQKIRENRSDSIRYDSLSPDEESYLKSSDPLKIHDTDMRVSGEIQGKQEEIEESMMDPSTCNFRGILHMTEDEIRNYEEPKKVEENIIRKDETSDRLERLEKLVELLASNVKPQQPQANISQETNTSSNVGILELIPRNVNFTTSMWLNKIQEECIERNLDEKSSIQFLQSKMSGIIKAWFKTVSSYDFTWPELKMLLVETFPDNVEFASTLRLLVERNKRADETVTQYYFSKMYLLDACRITGVHAVSCLIDGIENEFWKQEAKSYNFLTPEALYSHFLSKYSDFEYGKASGVQEPQIVYQVANTEHVGENKATFQKRNPRLRCYTCNKVGHKTAECRHAPICYHCKNKGHILANCPLRLDHSNFH